MHDAKTSPKSLETQPVADNPQNSWQKFLSYCYCCCLPATSTSTRVSSDKIYTPILTDRKLSQPASNTSIQSSTSSSSTSSSSPSSPSLQELCEVAILTTRGFDGSVFQDSLVGRRDEDGEFVAEEALDIMEDILNKQNKKQK